MSETRTYTREQYMMYHLILADHLSIAEAEEKVNAFARSHPDLGMGEEFSWHEWLTEHKAA